MSEKDGYFTLSFVMGEALPAAQMLESAQKYYKKPLPISNCKKLKKNSICYKNAL